MEKNQFTSDKCCEKKYSVDQGCCQSKSKCQPAEVSQDDFQHMKPIPKGVASWSIDDVLKAQGSFKSGRITGSKMDGSCDGRCDDCGPFCPNKTQVSNDGVGKFNPGLTDLLNALVAERTELMEAATAAVEASERVEAYALSLADTMGYDSVVWQGDSLVAVRYDEDGLVVPAVFTGN